jgi:hypothetical protein
VDQILNPINNDISIFICIYIKVIQGIGYHVNIQGMVQIYIMIILHVLILNISIIKL